jgi:hypothetical protein
MRTRYGETTKHAATWSANNIASKSVTTICASIAITYCSVPPGYSMSENGAPTTTPYLR